MNRRRRWKAKARRRAGGVRARRNLIPAMKNGPNVYAAVRRMERMFPGADIARRSGGP